MKHVAVIGGGIAGISAAYHLAERNRVTLLEAEAALTYHTTGRSAALFFETYGHGAIRPLTTASRPFLDDPPPGLADEPILTPRGALNIARPEQQKMLDSVIAEETAGSAMIRILDAGEARALVPALRPERLAGGLFEPGAADIDVAGLHQAFVRGAKGRGAEIRTSSPVVALEQTGASWSVETSAGSITADVVVNAAGAWGDRIAALAGIDAVGLVPKRRTAFMVGAPEGSRDWPLVFNVAHEWYFKPDGVQLLCSPADETPSEPCDARHDEIDVALGIERINTDTTLGIRSVRSAWAGLRTFAPDGGMVIGFEPGVEGFFWLVGQGGTGIQTSPAAGRLVADVVETGRPSADLAALGLDLDALSPGRLR